MESLPDLTLELADGPVFHAHPPRVSLQRRAVGIRPGPFHSPGLARTGKPVELDVRKIADFCDGLVSRIRLVVDMADAIRQLGVLPMAGSRAERAMAMVQRLRMTLLRRP